MIYSLGTLVWSYFVNIGSMFPNYPVSCSARLYTKLCLRKNCSFICSATVSCSAGPSCQCQPRLGKVFLSSSWTSHRVSKQTLANPDRLKQSNAGRGPVSQDIGTASSQHRGGKYINITNRHHHLAPSQSPNNSEKPPNWLLTLCDVQTHWRTGGLWSRIYIDCSGMFVSIVAGGRPLSLQEWIKLLTSLFRCITAMNR